MTDACEFRKDGKCAAIVPQACICNDAAYQLVKHIEREDVLRCIRHIISVKTV